MAEQKKPPHTRIWPVNPVFYHQLFCRYYVGNRGAGCGDNYRAFSVLIWDRTIPMMALFGGIAVAFFGGLTVFFNDPIFIKIKPTVISLLIAAVLAGGQLVGRNPLRAALSNQLQLSAIGWRQVTWIWVIMFVVSAMANEIAWRNLSDDGWVTFKAFGLTGISMGFALLTIPIMKKHGNLGR